MIVHDERGAFEPRLPDDPAYWSALVEHVAESAEPVFAELQTRRAWWGPLDRFGPALGIGAIAAAAVVFVALPGGSPATGPAGGATETSADPTDLLENGFRTPPAPDVMTLMVLGNEEPR